MKYTHTNPIKYGENKYQIIRQDTDITLSDVKEMMLSMEKIAEITNPVKWSQTKDTIEYKTRRQEFMNHFLALN